MNNRIEKELRLCEFLGEKLISLLRSKELPLFVSPSTTSVQYVEDVQNDTNCFLEEYDSIKNSNDEAKEIFLKKLQNETILLIEEIRQLI